MRKILVFAFAFLLSPVMAQIHINHGGNNHVPQQSALSITTFNQQGFWLFVDDILQNENPVRSISIQNMPASDYYIRVEMNNIDHNCVGQFVNLDRQQSFEFAQRNGFYGLIAIQGGFRPELTMPLVVANPQNGMPMPPAYSGLNLNDFNRALNQLKNESFDTSRLTLAKQIASGNMLTSAQITEICKLFSFENNALDFAKFAYQYCLDSNKYYLVNEAFKYDSSKRELNDYINGK